jgi:Caspase domain
MKKYFLIFGLSIFIYSHQIFGQAIKSSQYQEKRLALVIGNGNYLSGMPLANPENDAKAMKDALQSVGFIVYEYENLNQSQMKKAMDDFGEKLKGNDVGLFFYAGHGIQSKGYNFLIPVDAKLQSEQQVEYDCVQADRVLALMDASGTKVNIIILDACRNNPFERSWTRSTTGRGLAFMNAPTGSLIAYATSPGSTASDGSGNNGLYTSAILESIKIPDITIIEMFQNVRNIVSQKSNHKQTPWESTSLIGNFYFGANAFTESEIKTSEAVKKETIVSNSKNRIYGLDESENNLKLGRTGTNSFILFGDKFEERLRIGQIKKVLGKGNVECEFVVNGKLTNSILYKGCYIGIADNVSYLKVYNLSSLSVRDTILICKINSVEGYIIIGYFLSYDKKIIKYDYLDDNGVVKLGTASLDDIYKIKKALPQTPYIHSVYPDSLYWFYYRKENRLVNAKVVGSKLSKLMSQVEFNDGHGNTLLIDCSNQDLYPLNNTFDNFKINDSVYFINNRNERIDGKVIGYDPLSETLTILKGGSNVMYNIYSHDIFKNNK